MPSYLLFKERGRNSTSQLGVPPHSIIFNNTFVASISLDLVIHVGSNKSL